MTKIGDVKIIVKIEGQKPRETTAKEVTELCRSERRKFEILNAKGEVIIRKTFVGL